MEIELKYKIDSTQLHNRILSDTWLNSIAGSGGPETLRMKAAYFDTEDYTLIRHNIALRVRSEGEHTLATLKWRDDDGGISGLYIRSEINIPVSNQTCFFNPDPAMFKESAEGRDLLDIIDGRPLINVFDMIFIRKRMRIDYEKSILELALDEGAIVAGSMSEQFRELEIEIYSGTKEDLLAVGKRIADKYRLEPEVKTKFTRGVELLGSAKE